MAALAAIRSTTRSVMSGAVEVSDDHSKAPRSGSKVDGYGLELDGHFQHHGAAKRLSNELRIAGYVPGRIRDDVARAVLVQDLIDVSLAELG